MTAIFNAKNTQFPIGNTSIKLALWLRSKWLVRPKTTMGAAVVRLRACGIFMWSGARARHTTARALIVASVGFCVGGCAALNTPERLFSVDQEVGTLRNDVARDEDILRGLSNSRARYKRNEIIAARKYAIDLQYTQYEAKLTNEAQALDLASQVATISLDVAGDLAPVEHTARMLHRIGTGVGAVDSAYNEKVLLKHLIQDVQSSMRSERHERAGVIYANMRCSVKSYPVAMALSDLEAYYRAGTFQSGLMKLAQTVTEKEASTGAAADAQKPAASVDAHAKLAGLAVEANLKAQAATAVGKTRGSHKCTPEDLSG